MHLTFGQAEALGLGHLHPDHPKNRKAFPSLASEEASALVSAALASPGSSSRSSGSSYRKYRNVPTTYKGRKYHSKAEANRAEWLDHDWSIVTWTPQPRFTLGCPENVYVADFLVEYRTGRFVSESADARLSTIVSEVLTRVEDVKGVETAKFRHDKKLWESYGPYDLWVIRRGKVVEVIVGGGAKR